MKRKERNDTMIAIPSHQAEYYAVIGQLVCVQNSLEVIVKNVTCRN